MEAPDAVSVAIELAQTELLPVIVRVGMALTVTITVADDTQPNKLVPLTV